MVKQDKQYGTWFLNPIVCRIVLLQFRNGVGGCLLLNPQHWPRIDKETKFWKYSPNPKTTQPPHRSNCSPSCIDLVSSPPLPLGARWLASSNITAISILSKIWNDSHELSLKFLTWHFHKCNPVQPFAMQPKIIQLTSGIYFQSILDDNVQVYNLFINPKKPNLVLD